MLENSCQNAFTFVQKHKRPSMLYKLWFIFIKFLWRDVSLMENVVMGQSVSDITGYI